ncbi:hypothetical protein ACFQ07_15345, partial [Actinomadura adrarensis]
EALPREATGRSDLLAFITHTGTQLGPLAVPTRQLHGDLGPSNYFIDRGQLRVVDWEGSVPQGAPLAETVLFLNHYARALPGRHNQLPKPDRAFHEAFLGDTWLRHLTWETFRDELRSLALPPEAAEYLFVATLADLAGGHAPTAHAKRKGTQRNWTELLGVYASERRH